MDINSAHLKALLGMPEATDAELVAVLRQRVSHTSTTQCDPSLASGC